MNKFYKIIFVIGFVLSFLIAYGIYDYLLDIIISSNFKFFLIFLINVFYFLYLVLYIYDIVLMFINKDVIVDKKDIIVPIIYI